MLASSPEPQLKSCFSLSGALYETGLLAPSNGNSSRHTYPTKISTVDSRKALDTVPRAVLLQLFGIDGRMLQMFIFLSLYIASKNSSYASIHAHSEAYASSAACWLLERNNADIGNHAFDARALLHQVLTCSIQRNPALPARALWWMWKKHARSCKLCWRR